jgi:hypothetical protein
MRHAYVRDEAHSEPLTGQSECGNAECEQKKSKAGCRSRHGTSAARCAARPLGGRRQLQRSCAVRRRCRGNRSRRDERRGHCNVERPRRDATWSQSFDPRRCRSGLVNRLRGRRRRNRARCRGCRRDLGDNRRDERKHRVNRLRDVGRRKRKALRRRPNLPNCRRNGGLDRGNGRRGGVVRRRGERRNGRCRRSRNDLCGRSGNLEAAVCVRGRRPEERGDQEWKGERPDSAAKASRGCRAPRDLRIDGGHTSLITATSEAKRQRHEDPSDEGRRRKVSTPAGRVLYLQVPDVERFAQIHPEEGEMRPASMSIERAFVTTSEGMTRASQNAEPGDPGACRRR